MFVVSNRIEYDKAPKWQLRHVSHSISCTSACKPSRYMYTAIKCSPSSCTTPHLSIIPDEKYTPLWRSLGLDVMPMSSCWQKIYGLVWSVCGIPDSPSPFSCIHSHPYLTMHTSMLVELVERHSGRVASLRVHIAWIPQLSDRLSTTTIGPWCDLWNLRVKRKLVDYEAQSDKRHPTTIPTESRKVEALFLFVRTSHCI